MVVDVPESAVSSAGETKSKGVSTEEGFSVHGLNGCPSGMAGESEGFS